MGAIEHDTIYDKLDYVKYLPGGEGTSYTFVGEYRLIEVMGVLFFYDPDASPLRLITQSQIRYARIKSG